MGDLWSLGLWSWCFGFQRGFCITTGGSSSGRLIKCCFVICRRRAGRGLATGSAGSRTRGLGWPWRARSGLGRRPIG